VKDFLSLFLFIDFEWRQEDAQGFDGRLKIPKECGIVACDENGVWTGYEWDEKSSVSPGDFICELHEKYHGRAWIHWDGPEQSIVEDFIACRAARGRTFLPPPVFIDARDAWKSMCESGRLGPAVPKNGGGTTALSLDAAAFFCFGKVRPHNHKALSDAEDTRDVFLSLVSRGWHPLESAWNSWPGRPELGVPSSGDRGIIAVAKGRKPGIHFFSSVQEKQKIISSIWLGANPGKGSLSWKEFPLAEKTLAIEWYKKKGGVVPDFDEHAPMGFVAVRDGRFKGVYEFFSDDERKRILRDKCPSGVSQRVFWKHHMEKEACEWCGVSYDGEKREERSAVCALKPSGVGSAVAMDANVREQVVSACAGDAGKNTDVLEGGKPENRGTPPGKDASNVSAERGARNETGADDACGTETKTENNKIPVGNENRNISDGLEKRIAAPLAAVLTRMKGRNDVRSAAFSSCLETVFPCSVPTPDELFSESRFFPRETSAALVILSELLSEMCALCGARSAVLDTGHVSMKVFLVPEERCASKESFPVPSAKETFFRDEGAYVFLDSLSANLRGYRGGCGMGAVRDVLGGVLSDACRGIRESRREGKRISASWVLPERGGGAVFGCVFECVI